MSGHSLHSANLRKTSTTQLLPISVRMVHTRTNTGPLQIPPNPEGIMKPIRLASALLPALLLSTTLAFAADWHHGKLMDTEKQEVPTGSTTTYNTDAQAKNGKYSQNTTAHTADDTDTYQVFTIQTHTKTYIVRQKLNFPWSKPANITLGEDVKFMVQGNKMTILDDDQKQHKASIVKASVTQAQ